MKLEGFGASASRKAENIAPTFAAGKSNRERLAAVLDGELNFHGEDGRYASHDIHAFAAKFPPQLPRAFIRSLTRPGDMVLDPMMGSGTAVVEALLEGRRGIGIDLDPLALRLVRVKTTPSDEQSLGNIGAHVLLRAKELLSQDKIIKREIERRFDERTGEFIDYWFFAHTQCELMALTLAIEEVENTAARRFLELTFSSIIITKSGGVSRAYDLAHSRPHLVKDKIPKPAIDQFARRLSRNLTSIARLKAGDASVRIANADARAMPLADDSIDLIVTSPPYANAIDYMRAHKFSLVWLHHTIAELSDLRAKYLGSERVGRTAGANELPDASESIIYELAVKDKKKAAVLRKYFAEMKTVIAEMHRVLRPDCAAVLVVGTSTMRGIDVSTHRSLADIAATIGFEVVGVAERALDRNKRMMPARFGQKTGSMIEQRMHEEYVIGLLKPAKERQNADAQPNHH